jgi:DNA polymerase-3 subunit delta
MADLEPVYLVWGDDELRLQAWRDRVRKRALRERDSTLEVLKGDRLSLESAIEAIGGLTLSVGRRYVVIDGIGRWKESDLTVLADALAGLPPETVVLLIGSSTDDKKPPPKPPSRLAEAVEAGGGKVHICKSPKPEDYPKWLTERAQKDFGLTLTDEAAGALIDLIGQKQQRLVRELEKLKMYAGEETITQEDVEALAASAVERRIYDLGDALIDGNRKLALEIAEELRERGEDMMYIVFGLLRKLRDTQTAWAILSSGGSVRDVQSTLRMPQWVARQVAARAKHVDGRRLARALELLADLDYAIRGVGKLDPESSLTLTVAQAAAAKSAAAS